VKEIKRRAGKDLIGAQEEKEDEEKGSLFGPAGWLAGRSR
jgi:hypothetical protein